MSTLCYAASNHGSSREPATVEVTIRLPASAIRRLVALAPHLATAPRGDRARLIQAACYWSVLKGLRALEAAHGLPTPGGPLPPELAEPAPAAPAPPIGGPALIEALRVLDREGRFPGRLVPIWRLREAVHFPPNFDQVLWDLSLAREVSILKLNDQREATQAMRQGSLVHPLTRALLFFVALPEAGY